MLSAINEALWRFFIYADNLAGRVHKVEMAGLLSTQGILGEFGRMKSLKISLVALIAIGILAIAPSGA